MIQLQKFHQAASKSTSILPINGKVKFILDSKDNKNTKKEKRKKKEEQDCLFDRVKVASFKCFRDPFSF